MSHTYFSQRHDKKNQTYVCLFYFVGFTTHQMEEVCSLHHSASAAYKKFCMRVPVYIFRLKIHFHLRVNNMRERGRERKIFVDSFISERASVSFGRNGTFFVCCFLKDKQQQKRTRRGLGG